MAELYGKVTDIPRDKGGSVHIFDQEKNSLGGYAIIDGQIPWDVDLLLRRNQLCRGLEKLANMCTYNLAIRFLPIDD